VIRAAAGHLLTFAGVALLAALLFVLFMSGFNMIFSIFN
jgi:hypothetical protein